MVAFVVARPGSILDGLVALVGAMPDVRQIVQINSAEDALDFTQTLCPDITIIYAAPLTPDMATYLTKMKANCIRPILTIVNNESDRELATQCGADVVVMEGTPSSKLANHITQLLNSLAVNANAQKQETQS